MFFLFQNLENAFCTGTEGNSDFMTDATTKASHALARIMILLREGKLENTPETVVSILDGTHGARDGSSGFSFMPRIDDSKYSGSKMIKDRKEIIRELKRSPNVKITFQLFDMKDYHFCRPRTQSHKTGCVCNNQSDHTFQSRTKELSSDLTGKGKNLVWKWKVGTNPSKERAEKTTYLAFGWCYSFGGDVNLALRSDAEMSRLIMETNMKNIGIKGAELSEEQKEFLEKATDESIKDMFVEGK